MKEYIIKVDENKPDAMGSVPLIDKPKELVRCKDCVHRIVATASKWRISNGLSPYECKLHDILYSEPDWFCADGERR